MNTDMTTSRLDVMSIKSVRQPETGSWRFRMSWPAWPDADSCGPASFGMSRSGYVPGRMWTDESVVSAVSNHP